MGTQGRRRGRRPDGREAAPADPAAIAELIRRLPELTIRDRLRLGRRLEGIQRSHAPARPDTLSSVTAAFEAAVARRAARAASVPKIAYPEELPISQRRDDIAAAIRDHQVVIVAGETGSGKTTQLPKICLELGRGVDGLIGHTQPRRIAARTVADRIAEEVGRPLGSTVGYKVRFTDQVSPDTLVKVMTDGILLAELANDRYLEQYDTIIVDEAHERSLNIDFILGILTELLPRRPDLKLIITSATIDPGRFARHFGDAPIIEVSGRTYPVEVRYRPLVPEAADDLDHRGGREAGRDEDADLDDAPRPPRRATKAPEDEPRDQIQAICEAVDELRAEGPGDILVFLSGEREIRDTAEAIAGMNLRDTEVLPLYARLSIAEQHRVFAPHVGRRIVLATNVAETSLTVPGIRYVIDPGTARISRYSHRLKVQRLPIEPVSQASANQRAGRCGRVAAGICIRLYSDSDYRSRPEFTDAEILRTNLAGVILQMTAYGLGDVATFPFIDPPDRRNIADGVALLHELGAFGPEGGEPADKGASAQRLTPLGRRLAALPVDPRMARMVLEADRNGCVHEVMVIAAALSIVDPRERPTDRQDAAMQKHARFAVADSDFIAYLNLWNYLAEQQKALSGNQFRRLCRADFLNYLRVREWQDIYSQLRQTVKTLGITFHLPPADAEPDATRIHQSLLAGLLSHVGLKDIRGYSPKDSRTLSPEPTGRERRNYDYLGARGARFAIAPGSSLFRSQPRWVFAAELVETSRLWGRVVAKIEPEWAETLAGHLVRRSYSEPHWERKPAAVIASERVLLYGIPLVAGRRVNYGRIDPPLCREIFIRSALVEGDWETHHKFFAENQGLRDEVEELEARTRRRDIMVSDDDLYAFYDARIPADVVSGRHFDAWWKVERRRDPDLLSFEKSMLINSGAATVDPRDFPDTFDVDGVSLRLSYQFEPGTDADGVTVHVPLPALATLRPDPFDWQIPGLRADLVTALIRSLPKAKRVQLVPAPDTAAAALDRLSPDGRDVPDEPIRVALAAEFRRMTGVLIDGPDLDLGKVPEHLKMTYRVFDEHGKTLAEGKDLEALKRQLRVEAHAVVAQAASGIERAGLTAWPETGQPGNALPAALERRRGSYTVTAYPALVDAGDSVALRVFDTAAAAERAMVGGIRRLLLLTIPSPVPAVSRRLPNEAKLVLMRGPYANVPELMADCLDAAVDALVETHGGPARDEASFAALRDRVREALHDELLDVLTKLRQVLTAWHETSERLAGQAGGPGAGSPGSGGPGAGGPGARSAPRPTPPALAASLADARAQLAALVHPGFVTEAGAGRLTDLVRYLRALDRRLERLPLDPGRDAAQLAIVRRVQEERATWLTELPEGAETWPAVREVGWMVEELRVNLFAQAVGTPYPISEKRIYRAMDDVSADASGA